MRTTRLAAAGVAAVVGLSSAIAAADTTGDQIVTITVVEAPRSITVGEPTGDPLTVATGATASGSQTSTLAYSAGPDGAAKIEVTRIVYVAAERVEPSTGAGRTEWENVLGDLTLELQAVAAGGSEGTGRTFTIDRSLEVVDWSEDLVADIAVNEVVTGKQITYTLGGTATNIVFAGFAPVVDVVITFTITDADPPS